jgi:hypothetical protein
LIKLSAYPTNTKPNVEIINTDITLNVPTLLTIAIITTGGIYHFAFGIKSAL